MTKIKTEKNLKYKVIPNNAFTKEVDRLLEICRVFWNDNIVFRNNYYELLKILKEKYKDKLNKNLTEKEMLTILNDCIIIAQEWYEEKYSNKIDSILTRSICKREVKKRVDKLKNRLNKIQAFSREDKEKLNKTFNLIRKYRNNCYDTLSSKIKNKSIQYNKELNKYVNKNNKTYLIDRIGSTKKRKLKERLQKEKNNNIDHFEHVMTYKTNKLIESLHKGKEIKYNFQDAGNMAYASNNYVTKFKKQNKEHNLHIIPAQLHSNILGAMDSNYKSFFSNLKNKSNVNVKGKKHIHQTPNIKRYGEFKTMNFGYVTVKNDNKTKERGDGECVNFKIPKEKIELPEGDKEKDYFEFGFHTKIGKRNIYKKVKIFEKRNDFSRVKNVKLTKEDDGIYVCFNVEDEIEVIDPKKTKRIAGIDLGMKTFMTIYNGENDTYEKIEDSFEYKTTYTDKKTKKEKESVQTFQLLPKKLFAFKKIQELQKEADEINKKLKEEDNKELEKKVLTINKKITKLHTMVKNYRENAQKNLAKMLARKYDVIAFDVLDVTKLNEKWGEKSNDLAFGSFKNIVTNTFKREGKTVHVLNKWIATTQTCSNCGRVKQKNDRLKLDDRLYKCDHCGFEMDRDENAAKNIYDSCLNDLNPKKDDE